MITVILPAFNEEGAIGLLLESLCGILSVNLPGSRVVVVDDGSTDRTSEIVQSFRNRSIELIQHSTNKGFGEAIKTGLLSVVGTAGETDVIVTMDADNTHSPALLPRMIQCIRQGKDVVIASRFVPGSRVVGLSLWRRACSRMACGLFRLFFPIPGVKDYTSGYRAYRSDCLTQLLQRWPDEFISLSGFSGTVDILLKLRQMGAAMTEVPLVLRYDRKLGLSKMNVWQTIRGILSLVGKHWRNRNR